MKNYSKTILSVLAPLIVLIYMSCAPSGFHYPMGDYQVIVPSKRTVGDSIAQAQKIYASIEKVNVLIEQKKQYKAALQLNDSILFKEETLWGKCSAEYRRSLLIKANLCTYLEDYPNAIESYEQGLALQKQCKRETMKTAMILYYYGLMNTNIEEIEKADTCYTKALQLLDDLKTSRNDPFYIKVQKAQETLKYHTQSLWRRCKEGTETKKRHSTKKPVIDTK
jgi:tetratricopeptide (TPR) repeat protein